MKIIGISGSPRKGNSEFMLHTLLDGAKENDNIVDLISLRNTDIGFIGIKNNSSDFNQIIQKIIDSDIIVFSSPCYYDMISPQLLNLINLLDSYGEKLKSKKVIILISGKENYETSAKNATDYLKRVSKIYEMDVIGNFFGKSENSNDVSKNIELILELKEFGEKLNYKRLI